MDQPRKVLQTCDTGVQGTDERRIVVRVPDAHEHDALKGLPCIIRPLPMVKPARTLSHMHLPRAIGKRESQRVALTVHIAIRVGRKTP